MIINQTEAVFFSYYNILSHLSFNAGINNRNTETNFQLYKYLLSAKNYFYVIRQLVRNEKLSLTKRTFEKTFSNIMPIINFVLCDVLLLIRFLLVKIYA
jgi:hypothetical protein